MMDFKNLLGKLDQLNESVEVVAEEAKSVPQQQAAGAALAAKRGDAPKSKLTGASKEMMNMSEKELEKIAGTEHKGLPKKKKTESLDEANESPEQRLEAIKAAYEAGTRNLKSIEQMLMMTPPGGNRDQYEADLKWQQERLATLKKDYQALEAGMKGADDIRAQASAESFDSEAFRASFEEMVESKKKADKDYDEDGKIESPEEEYKGSKDKAIKKAMSKKKTDESKTTQDGSGPYYKEKEAEDLAKKDGKDWRRMSYGDKEDYRAKVKKMSEEVEDINESFDKFFTGDKLTFEEAVKIVRESGGQQKIDPVDTALWNWAQRVATNKFEESRKAEMFAGLIYERNGGRFEMYDVLKENNNG